MAATATASTAIATATAPEIRVSVMFAERTSSEWKWIHCLTFPLDTLNKLQFTCNPYKWVRYATGVVVGAHGDLSLGSVSPHVIVNYDLGLPSESVNLFYHTSDAEKDKMFPIDPNMGHTNITSSEATSRRVQFRSDVLMRDGSCVVTGDIVFNCEAAHILAHSKGDEYIKLYTENRSRDPAKNDHVNEIDSVRNGILLNSIAHKNLGLTVAFLMTPNFAMNTADIDPTASPTEKRCTAHLFDPDHPSRLGDPALRSGCQVRMPNTANNWPPDILFDAVYAEVVLLHFATQSLWDELEEWKSIFYPDPTNAAEPSHQRVHDVRTAEDRKIIDAQNKAHDRRAAKRAGECFDLLMLMPYIVWQPDKLRAVWREAAEKRAETEQRHLADKVVGWAKDVADARP